MYIYCFVFVLQSKNGEYFPHYVFLIALYYFSFHVLITIQVKSFHYLEELEIATNSREFTSVDVKYVPNLCVFHCDIYPGPICMRMVPTNLFKTHSISLGSSLTQLSLGGQGLVTDDESLNMIESGLFPFLESLTLNLVCWRLASFRFTCPASSPIKRFFLKLCPYTVTEIQINAVDLIFFSNIGSKITTTSFPISKTLEEMRLQVLPPMGGYSASCLVKLRETLELSNKCYLDLCTHVPPLHVDFDLDDLKTRLEFLRFPPATNVQTLTFETCKDECKWNNSEFFDAFFEICRPKQVFANKDAFFQNNNHFCKLMLTEVLHKKTTTKTTHWSHYLKKVQIRTRHHKRWETLSNSHTRFLDCSTPINATFKLEWC